LLQSIRVIKNQVCQREPNSPLQSRMPEDQTSSLV
jgi:hypothetical protein